MDHQEWDRMMQPSEPWTGYIVIHPEGDEVVTGFLGETTMSLQAAKWVQETQRLAVPLSIYEIKEVPGETYAT